MIVCTGNDDNFSLYKETIKDRKVYFHIKDIFNDHCNKYKSTSTRRRRPFIDKIINKFLSCKSFFLGYSIYECPNCHKKKLFLILVKLDFVLLVVINIMTLELFLFSLNFLNGNTVMLFLLFLKN